MFQLLYCLSQRLELGAIDSPFMVGLERGNTLAQEEIKDLDLIFMSKASSGENAVEGLGAVPAERKGK